MIYATDDKGKIDPTFSPIIDGSLGSCDQLFRLLLSYLKALNVKDASKVLFIADGATWIWNRVPSLITSLGLTTEQTQQRIDYWHAVEYLGKIVESSSLKGKQKTQWRKTQKNRLYRGDIGLVVIAIRAVDREKTIRGSDDMEELFRESRSDSPPDGLPVVRERPSADRQRRDRKRRASRHQPSREEQRHLLAPRKRRNHHPLPSMDQSRKSRRTFPPNNLRHTATCRIMPTDRESALSTPFDLFVFGSRLNTSG